MADGLRGHMETNQTHTYTHSLSCCLSLSFSHWHTRAQYETYSVHHIHHVHKGSTKTELIHIMIPKKHPKYELYPKEIFVLCDGRLQVCQTSGLTIASWPPQRSFRHTAVKWALRSFCLLTYRAILHRQVASSVHTSWFKLVPIPDFCRRGEVWAVGQISSTELFIWLVVYTLKSLFYLSLW